MFHLYLVVIQSPSLPKSKLLPQARFSDLVLIQTKRQFPNKRISFVVQVLTERECFEQSSEDRRAQPIGSDGRALSQDAGRKPTVCSAGFLSEGDMRDGGHCPPQGPRASTRTFLSDSAGQRRTGSRRPYTPRPHRKCYPFRNDATAQRLLPGTPASADSPGESKGDGGHFPLRIRRLSEMGGLILDLP